MLRKFAKNASKEKMLILIDGIILSKIRYNLGIIGNLWITSPYSYSSLKFTTFTKKDLERLQVTMNKALRLAARPKERNYPTSKLLEETKTLSIHQEIAYQIGSNVKKILDTQRPESLYKQFKTNKQRSTRHLCYKTPLTRLQVTHESFCNTGIRLLNLLPPELMATQKMERFKKDLKVWIKKNIPIKP